MLFFALLLLQFKLPLLFGFSLFFADLFPFGFHFFPLGSKSLLRFCADTDISELLFYVPLSAFRIIRSLLDFCFECRTEFQFIIMPKNKLPYLVIFWFCSKSHFAD